MRAEVELSLTPLALDGRDGSDVSQDSGNDDNGEHRRVTGRWYATSFDVGHNAFEFNVDCDQASADDVMTVVFRVIASPHSARELFRQLGMSLIRYADTFGPIDGDDTPAGEER